VHAKKQEKENKVGMLPSLQKLDTLSLRGDCPRDATTTGATPSGENPVEQDFDVQEEYDLDAYHLVHELLRSYRPAGLMNTKRLLGEFGFQHDPAKDAAFEQLERARLAMHLDPREAPTVHSGVSGMPSRHARVNTIQNMMAVGKPLGGYKEFYMATMARCVGKCREINSPGNYDNVQGTDDCTVVFGAMPIAPLQKPYTMFDPFDATSALPMIHPWANTCGVRSAPSGVTPNLWRATADPDVRVALDCVQINETSSTVSSGSNNIGREWNYSKYANFPGAVDRMMSQFSNMRIKSTNWPSTDPSQLLADPTKLLWNNMARKTQLFVRSSKRGVSLVQIIAEAYNTLLAAVMGLTPPIYQLIITPLGMGPTGAWQVINSENWDVAATERKIWRLIVVSEAAYPGQRATPIVENPNPGPISGGRFKNATHKNHLTREYEYFQARRCLSIQTRLAEFGFVMSDNKLGNTVVQKAYTWHPALARLESDRHDVLQRLGQTTGDVLAIDFDIDFTFHVDTMKEDKGNSPFAYRAIYGATGGDMYTLPFPSAAVIIDAACIRFVNLMVYCINLGCGANSRNGRHHKELTYMVAAMTRFTAIPAHNKTALCQYFFHVKDPDMIAQNYLDHERHKDRATHRKTDNVPGPGYSLQRHSIPQEAQVGPRPTQWGGKHRVYEGFLDDLSRVWHQLDAWDYGEVEWEDFWVDVVANIRERVNWYGLRAINQPGGDGCRGKLAKAARVDVVQFLRSTLGGGGNWEASALLQPDTRPGVGAVLSFPLVILSLIVKSAELFKENEKSGTPSPFAKRPDQWPAPPMPPNKPQKRSVAQRV
jgi:hypothetical protein